jgi:hypothetical protein
MTNQLKTLIKSTFPFLVPLRRRVGNLLLDRRPPKQVFTEIVRENIWEDPDSVSGTGSNLKSTEAVRRVLPALIREMECRSVLDVPCGDFYWMKLVQLDADYVGGDIVDELIADNQKKYGAQSRRFINLDLLQDELPKVDLILCRDCLVHFSYRNIFRALRNIKSSGSKYLLTTTYVDQAKNADIPTGAWRPLDLQLAPFSFPSPMRLIDEECPPGNDHDKRLGLWRISDIPERGWFK